MNNSVLKLVTSPWRMKLFLMTKLPMAFFAGLKVIHANHDEVSVSVPNKFMNKNPFKSIYFAVLSMAAELPSGILAMHAVKNSSIPVSMLVLNMRASFIKKAKTKVLFKCSDGKSLFEAVDRSVNNNTAETVVTKSIGTDSQGIIIAEFYFEWTFKPYNQ